MRQIASGNSDEIDLFDVDHSVEACIICRRMFERFTHEARQVVVLAQDEARALGHNYIGTEHLLLGLLRDEEERADAERPLRSLGVTLAGTRERVRRIVGSSEHVTAGQIPFTPRAKKVLELALREALSHGHNWIGPEHILLGLARENEGVASRVLMEFDADAVKLREAVALMLARAPRQPRLVQVESGHLMRMPMEASWFDGLALVLTSLAREIRQELDRDPDVGDLLLTIACARDGLAGQALEELGIDLDALWGLLERARQRRTDEREELDRKIEEVRTKKREALEREQFQDAARLRDEERELSEKLRSPDDFEDEDVLREVRRRLGLSGAGG
jgi:ATP-dependent Clp protease ATP-binding subunit ClpA